MSGSQFAHGIERLDRRDRDRIVACLAELRRLLQREAKCRTELAKLLERIQAGSPTAAAELGALLQQLADRPQ